MTTPFNLPVPKIGNHPTSCPCGTCDNARKRLAKSPYVQQLQGLVLQFHEQWQEAMNAGLSIQQDLDASSHRLKNARARYAGGEEAGQKMHQEISLLKFELQQMTTERDGYAAGLKVLTTEANTQRLAADTATTRVSKLLTENTELRTQLTQSADTLRQEQNASRGAVLIVLIVTALVSSVAFFLIGRFGR